MKRRQYLTGACTTGLTLTAGCLDDDDGEGDDDDSGDGNGSQYPAWTAWVPASIVTLETRVNAIDIDALREEFPADVYAEFQVSDLPSAFGFEATAMDVAASVVSQAGTSLEVITGSFDVASILSNIQATDEVNETYDGFEMIDGRDLAIGSEAIIIGERRAAIDTNSGEQTPLGRADDDWGQIVPLGGDGTVFSAEAAPFISGQQPPFEVQMIGTTFDSLGGRDLRAMGYYLFESSEKAQEIRENQRDALTNHFLSASEATFNSVEQNEAVLIIDAETTVDAL